MSFVEDLGPRPGEIGIVGACNVRSAVHHLTDEVGDAVAESMQSHVVDWLKKKHPEIIPAVIEAMNDRHVKGGAFFHYDETKGAVRYTRPAEQTPPTIDDLGNYLCSLARDAMRHAADLKIPTSQKLKVDFSHRLTTGPLAEACMLFQIKIPQQGVNRGC